MEWFKEISQLVVNLAWPAIAASVIVLFRKELIGLFRSVKEVKYPGGSITVEVTRLEETIKEGRAERLQGIKTTGAREEYNLHRADPQIAVAQLRVEMEKELFRLSWRALNNSEIRGWDAEKHVYELEASKKIDGQSAEGLRSFLRIANEVLHGADVGTETKNRLASIGAELVAQLHFERKVTEMMEDFRGHGLWHMHRHLPEERTKYYFYSAVAASLPEFDYNYEIYQAAMKRYNERCMTEDNHEGNARDQLYSLSLEDFVRVLELRERELLKLIDIWHHHDGDTWKAFEKANYWRWPSEWGDLGWTAPIIRERLSLYSAEDDLMQTRNSLNQYRRRLIDSVK